MFSWKRYFELVLMCALPACGVDFQFNSNSEIPHALEEKQSPLSTSTLMAARLKSIFGDVVVGGTNIIDSQVQRNRETYGGPCDSYRKMSGSDCNNSADLQTFNFTQVATTPFSFPGRMGWIQRTCHMILDQNSAVDAACQGALGDATSCGKAMLESPSLFSTGKLLRRFYSATLLSDEVVGQFQSVGDSAWSGYCAGSPCREGIRYILLAACISPYWHLQ